MRARFLFVGRMQLQINNKRGKTKVTPVEADWSQQYQHRLMACFINKHMQIDTDINVNTDASIIKRKGEERKQAAFNLEKAVYK